MVFEERNVGGQLNMVLVAAKKVTFCKKKKGTVCMGPRRGDKSTTHDTNGVRAWSYMMETPAKGEWARQSMQRMWAVTWQSACKCWLLQKKTLSVWARGGAIKALHTTKMGLEHAHT